jgi:hypothetical protein
MTPTPTTRPEYVDALHVLARAIDAARGLPPGYTETHELYDRFHGYPPAEVATLRYLWFETFDRLAAFIAAPTDCRVCGRPMPERVDMFAPTVCDRCAPLLSPPGAPIARECGAIAT